MNMVIFLINTLAVPAISLQVISRRQNRTICFNAQWLVTYLVYMVINIPCSHLAVLVIRKALNREIAADTSKYTLIAAAVAFCLPYVLEAAGKILPSCRIEKR